MQNDQKEADSQSKRKLDQTQFDILNQNLDNLEESQQSRESKRKDKKRRKQIQKLLAPPSIKLNMDHLALKRNNLIKIKDWQSLILYLIGDGISTPWALIQDRSNVRQVVCLMVQGILPQDVFPTWDEAQIKKKIQSDIGKPERSYVEPLSVHSIASSSSSFKTNAGAKFGVKSTSNGPILQLAESSPLKELNDIFQCAVLTNGPGEKTRINSPLSALLECPLTSAQKAKAKEILENTKISDISDYCLSLDDLHSNEYPLFTDLPEGWIRPPKSNSCTTAKENNDGYITVDKSLQEKSQLMNSYLKRNVIAIDCEMSYTAKGLVLTRISAVNQKKQVLLDTFVKPDDEITDYNTRYSGITEQLLKDVKTSLSDVQKILCGPEGLIDEETILVGHSLENDLNVLQITHDKIIDTSVIYHSSRGPPQKPSLKYLAERFLNKIIQQDMSHDQSAKQGHDSIIDATICIELLEAKIKNGFSFGLTLDENESLFSKLKDSPGSAVVASLNKLYGEGQQISSCIIDNWKICNQFGQDVDKKISIKTDDEAFEQLSQVCQETIDSSTVKQAPEDLAKFPKYQFIFSRLRSVHKAMDDIEVTQVEVIEGEDGEIEEVPIQKKSREEILSNISHQIQELYKSMPSSSVLIVLSGLGDNKAAQKLIREKQLYQKLVKQHGASVIHNDDKYKQFVFDEKKMASLEVECAYGRLGVGFTAVKQ